jgi:hypothetical protein
MSDWRKSSYSSNGAEACVEVASGDTLRDAGAKAPDFTAGAAPQPA